MSEPLIDELAALAKLHHTSEADVLRRAGLNKNAFVWWRRGSIPRLPNVEAAFNVLGYELRPVKRRDSHGR